MSATLKLCAGCARPGEGGPLHGHHLLTAVVCGRAIVPVHPAYHRLLHRRLRACGIDLDHLNAASPVEQVRAALYCAAVLLEDAALISPDPDGDRALIRCDLVAGEAALEAVAGGDSTAITDRLGSPAAPIPSSRHAVSEDGCEGCHPRRPDNASEACARARAFYTAVLPALAAALHELGTPWCPNAAALAQRLQAVNPDALALALLGAGDTRTEDALAARTLEVLATIAARADREGGLSLLNALLYEWVALIETLATTAAVGAA